MIKPNRLWHMKRFTFSVGTLALAGLLALLTSGCEQRDQTGQAVPETPPTLAAPSPTAEPTTPAETAPEKKKRPKSVEVSFSQKRGFYEAPFDLALTTKETGVTIRFTTNGLPPTVSSGAVYTQPIPIRGTTVIRAAAFRPEETEAESKTHTFLFLRDVVSQSPDGLPPAGWPYEWGENKVDYGMDPRVTGHPDYRDELIPALKSLPTFSLVMDLDDLFSRERGIYATAQERGREAERAGSLELIRPDGEKGFQIDCGVRIRGGFSRMPMNPKHAFRLFFRKEYGEGKLKYPLFGPTGAQSFDHLDLRCAQNYSWSLAGDHRGVFLRDQFNRDLQLAMGQPAARGDFCHLYINGQYWGLFDTCERPEASYGESYFGGKKEDYDVVKSGGGFGRGREDAPEVADGNIDAWKRLWTAAKQGLTDNADYFRLQGLNPDGSRNRDYDVLLDPINLIDYMLVILYGGNFDAPISKFMGDQGANNWHGLRNRKGEHGFRFFVWDAEHTLLDLEEDRVGPFPCGDRFGMSNPQWLWQQCLENAEFRLLVADRVSRHFFHDGVLAPDAVIARFQKRVNEIEKAVVAESARWGDAQEGGGFMAPPRIGPDGRPESGPLTREHWRREVQRLVTEYFPRRTQAVLDQLWRAGLLPDTPAPSFNQRGGSAPEGFAVELKGLSGSLYYTLDGTDPRAIGGSLSPSASTYSAPITLTRDTTILCRARLDGDWGPLGSATFRVGVR